MTSGHRRSRYVSRRYRPVQPGRRPDRHTFRGMAGDKDSARVLERTSRSVGRAKRQPSFMITVTRVRPEFLRRINAVQPDVDHDRDQAKASRLRCRAAMADPSHTGPDRGRRRSTRGGRALLIQPRHTLDGIWLPRIVLQTRQGSLWKRLGRNVAWAAPHCRGAIWKCWGPRQRHPNRAWSTHHRNGQTLLGVGIKT